MTKMYIAVLDEFPDYMVPALVGHAVLGHHSYAQSYMPYEEFVKYVKWRVDSFKKCVVRVNQKEFGKISQLPSVTLHHESNTLDGKKACAVIVVGEEIPNVLKFAKLWKPK